MAGIGKLLLFDEGVVVQPVEELRAVGADDLGLRIMDVGVDEAGHDEAARMIVDRRVVRRARKYVARLADRRNQPVARRGRPHPRNRWRPTTRPPRDRRLKVRMRPRMTRAFTLKAEYP